jgi:hypothetical protein
MRWIGLLFTAAVLALAPAGTAADGKPRYGCPPGFNLEAFTFAEYLELPRTVAAINGGFVTEQDVLAALSRIDKNGNEVVCVQLSRGKIEGNNPFGEFFYNVVDDNASKP